MSRRAIPVDQLAKQAEMDLDEALVTLWEAGLDWIDGPEDVIPSRQVAVASRALGVAVAKEQMNVSYWVRVAGQPREQITEALAQYGVHMSPTVRRVPRGSLRYLRRLYAAPAARDAAEQVESAKNLATVAPFEWPTIGEEGWIRLLTVDEIKGIHAELEEDFSSSPDPILPPGIRDYGLLDMAATRPTTSIGEHRKYPTVEMAAAAMFYSLVHNHAFFNGNKRTALVGLLAMLHENDKVFSCSQDDLFKFTLRTAQHGLVPTQADQRPDREVLEIAWWIRSNSRPIERGERPMKWHKLKRRLRDFGCTYERPKVGNRLNVYREVRRRRLIGSTKLKLSTQVACAGDGTEADRNTIRKLRSDLHLDDAHDVDSSAFYAGAEVDQFIIDYRGILSRLAKL